MKTTLLIVDDESWVRDTIKALLKQEASPVKDVELKEAKNGIEALDYINDIQPELMITDMKMPGIDGKELLKIVEKEHQELPVIVLSGYHDFVYTKQAIKSRVVEYLLKPVNQSELYNAVEKALEQKSKLEQQNIHYHLLSINRPEIPKIIQPFHKNLYFDLKEANLIQFTSNMQRFGETVDKFLKTDESFIFHFQRKYIEMIEEIMQEYRLHLDDLNVDLRVFNIKPTSSFDHVIQNQIKLGQAIIQKIEENKKHKSRIDSEEIKQFIDSYYDSPDMSLDVVAKQFFVSKEYLTTVFKRKYGHNITEYIISLRMKKAKELVKNTTMQYKTIAEKIGYEDVPYFYRVFKKFYHVSPGEMRKT